MESASCLSSTMDTSALYADMKYDSYFVCFYLGWTQAPTTQRAYSAEVHRRRSSKKGQVMNATNPAVKTREPFSTSGGIPIYANATPHIEGTGRRGRIVSLAMLFYPPIRFNVGECGYTQDWAAVEVDQSKIDKANFVRNFIDLDPYMAVGHPQQITAHGRSLRYIYK